MKTYIIKPESIDLFGSEANAYTVIAEDMLDDIAAGWEKSVDEILEHLIEDDSDKHAWKLLYRFAGAKLTREQLNNLIAFESGDPEPFFPTEDDFKQAVRDGFVKWDNYYTTIWIDD